MGTLAALFLTAPVSGLAQDPAAADSTPLTIGSRVRVKAQGAQRYLIGNLLAAPGDSLRLSLASTSDTVTQARASLVRFDVSRGSRSRAGRGAVIGFGVGAVVGLIVGAATYDEGCGSCIGPDPGRGGSAVIGGVLLGAMGLGIGALIGRNVDGEQWVSVDPKAGRQDGL